MNVSTPRRFQLYPAVQRWWSFTDYATVLDVVQGRHATTILEFGPGSSTLALIEGGATQIDCCEDEATWFDVYTKRLVYRYPEVVTLHAYTWQDPLSIPALNGKRYDLALVDGPRLTPRRPACIAYALERATAVLVPTEDDGAPDRSFLRPILEQLAAEYGRALSIFETGPLAGGFALLTLEGP
jgi:hypothetical protein